MNKTYSNGSTKSPFSSIGSENTSMTKERVYYNRTKSVIENPFETLNNKLDEIAMPLKIIVENHPKPVEKSDLIDLKEACDLLKISSSSIYKMSASNTIPVIKRKGSNRLIFSRSKLTEWVLNSHHHKPSKVNLVDEYLNKKIRVRREQNN